MSVFIMALQLVLCLSLLIFIHEMGHFLAARAFGIRVTKFYLFFDAWGVKLFSFKWGETEFGMGWLPLGGYCQIAGMIDETQKAEDLQEIPQDWEFRTKPAWQRLIVMFGGIFLNFLTGIIILSLHLLYAVGGYLSNEEVAKYGVHTSSLGQEIGFCDGDKILQVKGKNVVRFQDAHAMNVLFGAEITVLRDADTVHLTVPKNTYRRVVNAKTQLFSELNFPLYVDSVAEGTIAQTMGILPKDRICQINQDTIHSYGDYLQAMNTHKNQAIACVVQRDTGLVMLNATLDSLGKLGIYAHIPYQATAYTLTSALRYGYKDAWDLLKANTKGIGKLFTGEEKASESVQGPIGMARIFGAELIWARFWFVTGIISLILAFMNFLPIPALDGGHILFTLWEILTGKKPGEKFLTIAQNIGMMLLLALMVFAVGNDILKIFQ